MKIANVRKCLAIYFFLMVVGIGMYLYLCAEKWLLPISKSDAEVAAQIILPAFFSPITLIFNWYYRLKTPEDKKVVCPISTWTIILPPLLVFIIFIVTTIALITGNFDSENWWAISPETYRWFLVFAVSILNLSTVKLVSALFSEKGECS